MSREIKFRFWDEYNKQYSEEPFYRITISNDGQVYNSENDEWYEVNTRYVIQQFTGLKDKNGIEVYEGDIVNVRGSKRVGFYTTEIIYSGLGFCLKENNTILKDYKIVSSAIEVIGNIYETPELLQS